MSQATTALQLRLLGKPRVQVEGTVVTGFRTAKAEALLYYLAVTGQAHSRETLADLLWGELPEATAKRNLTKALSHLRKQFAPFLAIEPETIGLDPAADVWLDTAIFEATVVQGLADEDFDLLTQAVQWYQGDLLAGFYVKQALSFEEWLLSERERLRELMLQALQQLVSEAIKMGEHATGLEYAHRLLALEPWQETAHRQMMLLLARSGRREAALAQYETCRQILAEELGVEPMAETTALYERLKAAGAPPPHNLPPSPNVFVGRETELQHIERQLADPACQLLTVVGPGGIGKTRLAVEAARRYIRPGDGLLEPDVSDGVYIVSLVSISGEQALSGPGRTSTGLSNALVSAVADAVGLSFQGAADLGGQLLTHLRQKAMLLVLDNFEQLIIPGVTQPGHELATGILQQAPRIKLLVTSRERLNLQEEWMIEVAGLEYPMDGWEAGRAEDWTASDVSESSSPPTSQSLNNFSAVTLFVQRAQQTLTDFSLTEADLTHVVRICQLVEGMPLGLELAASWLRVLPCAEIVAEIEQSLNFLESAWRNVPERHRSLRAVFDRSWQMLSPQEQAALRRLSIFRGGFQQEAARQVGGASLAMLTGLVDKSLLRRSHSGRYDIHELLRQYAAEKLLLEEEDDQSGGSVVWQQHSDYYLNFIHGQEGQLRGNAPQQTVAETRLELDNLRQAWRWAVANNRFDPLGRSIDALAIFYELTGLFDEAAQAFDSAAGQLTRLEQASQPLVQEIICHLLVSEAEFAELRGNHDLARTRAEQVIQRTNQVTSSRYRADARRILGILARGDFDQVQTHFNEAIPIYQALGEKRQLATIYDWLGLMASDQRLLDEALAYLGQAQQLHQEADNERGQVFNLGMTAVVYSVMGRLEDALTSQQEVLSRYEQLDYPLGMARTANNIGLLHHELGAYEAAVSYLDQASQVARQIGSLSTVYNALGNKGESLLALGRYDQAHRCYGQALDYFQETGMTWRECEIQWRLGQLYLCLGDDQQAQQALCNSLALPGAEEDPEALAIAHGLLGMMHHRQGNGPQALEHFDIAIALFPQARRSLTLATLAHLPKATLLLERGEIEAAQALLDDVQPLLAQQIGRHPIRFESQLLQTRIALACGDRANARQQLEKLLAESERPAEQAAVHYELWRIAGDGVCDRQSREHGETALRLYADLEGKTPDVVYQARLQALRSSL